jgi:hypothetical protein
VATHAVVSLCTGPKKGPKRTKRLSSAMCVLCEYRPMLCRSLCNGCYQKWHKQKKHAEERGLPPPPCPSIAILERMAVGEEASHQWEPLHKKTKPMGLGHEMMVVTGAD